MSDAVDRGRALLARMERTDSVSFHGARTVVLDLCTENEGAFGALAEMILACANEDGCAQMDVSEILKRHNITISGA